MQIVLPIGSALVLLLSAALANQQEGKDLGELFLANGVGHGPGMVEPEELPKTYDLADGSPDKAPHGLNLQHCYPLSVRQLQKGIRVDEMRARIVTSRRTELRPDLDPCCVSKLERYVLDYSKGRTDNWAEKLGQIRSDLDAFYAKKPKKGLIGKALHLLSEKTPLEQFREYAQMSRSALVSQALYNAVPRKKNGVIDRETLTDLLVPQSNLEHAVVEIHGSACYALQEWTIETIFNNKNDEIFYKLCYGLSTRDEGHHEADDEKSMVWQCKPTSVSEVQHFLSKIGQFDTDTMDRFAGFFLTCGIPRLRAFFREYGFEKLVADLNAAIVEAKEKQLHYLQVLKAVVQDIQLGRPHFIAQRLKKYVDKLADPAERNAAFAGVSRILLSRAPIDLADIDEEFAALNGGKGLESSFFTLLHNGHELGDEEYTLHKFAEIVQWARHQFGQ